MKRVVLIVNPFASRVTAERISAVERALMRVGYVRTVRTERPRHAVELARDAGEADALIVFSGDGGFNEALNGVERDDLPLGRSSRSTPDRKSTRLNSSHPSISYAVFCLKKKNKTLDRKTVNGHCIHSKKDISTV